MAHTKLNYIHVFRAIAIILIVAGHCLGSCTKILGHLFNVILNDGTVLFVFIAGFLFQYLSDNFSYPIYLKKKFFNVLLPYIFTSIFGIVVIFLSYRNNPFMSVNKIIQTGMFLTIGWVHNPPTWYIPMTSIFFLFATILLKCEKKVIFKRYSLLFLLLPLLIFLSCVVPRYGTNGGSFFVTKDMTAWQAYVGYLHRMLFSTMLFFPVYILGMFLAKYKDIAIKTLYKKRILLYGIFIVSCIIHFLLLCYDLLPGRLLLPKIALTLLLLGYLYNYDDKIMAHFQINNTLGVVADYSFSIFFLHYYFIMGFNKIFEYVFHWKDLYLQAENFHFGCWLLYAGMKFIIAFFGSLFVAMLIKKILEKLGVKHTRYFIGA